MISLVLSFLAYDVCMERKLDRNGIHVVVGTIVSPIFLGGLLFLAAGRIDLPTVWVFLCVSTITLTIATIIMWVHDPELLNQRGAWKKKTDAKRWDRFVVYMFGVIGYYVQYIVIGLDVGRFEWSQLGIPYVVTGLTFYVVGASIVYWSMYVNKHFETTVRIQTDRGHTVITDGPYKIVRHPGYVGAILWAIGTPLAMGSLYGIIPGAIASLALIVRTHFEDKTLQEELAGYTAYAKKTHYKLLPGIW